MVMSKEFYMIVLLLLALGAGMLFYTSRPFADTGLTAEEEARVADRIKPIPKKSAPPSTLSTAPGSPVVNPAAATNF